MSNCPGCEILPEPIPNAGQLLLWPPLGHTSAKLRGSLCKLGVEITEPAANCLSAPISLELWEAARNEWSTMLSQVEMRDCRCLVLPSSATTLSIDHLAQMTTLDTLLGRLAGSWLIEIISQRRLTTFFQPIVHIDDPLEIFAYECLVRGHDRDGRLVSPYALYGAARGGKMMFHLDRAARLQHIRAANEHAVDTRVFINFNPTSIYDPNYCLRSTVEAIHRTGMAPDRFVFEVVESDEITDPRRLPEILQYYRDAGFLVALDDVGAGFSSLNLLTKLKPDFVKFDMELMRDIDRDAYKASIVSKLLQVARELEIGTVVEGIESVGEWQWAVEHGAQLAQGYLFGKPNPEPRLSFSFPAALTP